MAKNFKNLSHDASGKPMQVASSIYTQDGTLPAPQISPLVYSNVVITIAVPENAAEMVLNPTSTIRISELATMARYSIIPANVLTVVPCGKGELLYIVRDSADGNLRFHFHLV